MNRTARLRVESLEDRATPAAGQLDPTFGGGDGFQQFGTQMVSDVAVAADGHVFALTGPRFNSGPATLVRFNPDGTLDTSFGTGGSVVIPNTSSFGDIAPTADGGAYVAAGYITR